MSPSHYLNQSWFIVKWNLKNKIQLNLNNETFKRLKHPSRYKVVIMNYISNNYNIYSHWFLEISTFVIRYQGKQGLHNPNTSLSPKDMWLSCLKRNWSQHKILGLNWLLPSDAHSIRDIVQHWDRYWLLTCSLTSHYLDQCWLIVNWNLTIKHNWNLNHRTHKDIRTTLIKCY